MSPLARDADRENLLGAENELSMLYMVVERFKAGAAETIYQRARERGRLMPPGLEYVASWIDVDLTICFQLMRADDPSLFVAWTSAWRDLVDFEIYPVQTSAETARAMAARSDRPSDADGGGASSA